MVAAISAFAAWLYGLIPLSIIALYDMLKDAACWIFDQLLTLRDTALTGMDFSALASYNPGALIGQLPPEVLNVTALAGLHDCVAIIVGACLVRMTIGFLRFLI
jgi:hypothetical protein